MNKTINQLLQFGLDHQMIDENDLPYAANQLIDLLKIDSFEREHVEAPSLYPILDDLLDYAVKNNLCEDTVTSKDLFDTRIMDCLMPRPSEVVRNFWKEYEEDPQKATDDYYQLSINSNYIRKSRTDKNINFKAPSRYGDIQISINLSKPEKDPKEIAAARNVKSSGYPKCLLCPENVGYAGHANHPARQTHRIIPLNLKSGKYFMQYSPYVYYNEHCIILNENHIPMRIDRNTFENLFEFITLFPHYMLGSNTDIPIVGGSILTHDHYQGGRHRFPIQDAHTIDSFELDGVHAEIIEWPLSTLRLRDKNPEKLVDLADRILAFWKEYEDLDLDIIPYTGSTRHNAITPIARMNGDEYEIDLVFRNNRTSEQYPDGIFHPHPEHHHIKKENIGLIEVMGLAVLPARLKDELVLVEKVLTNQLDASTEPSLDKHANWIESLKAEYTPEMDVHEFVNQQTGAKFVSVLENAGVFKMDEEGLDGFRRFIRKFEETL
ncbi:UDP-glucose--hexose-1-phosphate uridylyltransferase [Ileibacterium valens]|uniref:UDP-glucose--hexose-1-phosphate uridylyltransferase n=1 Tax=Ileibacterium valens TaxID=1862668 RepID=UPI00272BF888|nr:UDP-glucose--hexose-1-phosphate uridylyltransferase [Ileibacterium valens]